MSTSMREALDAAFKKQEEIGGSEEDAEEPVRDSPEEEPAEESEQKEVAKDDDAGSEVQGDEEEGDGGHPEEESAKGEASDKPAKTPPAKSGGKEGDGKDAAPADGDLKAPVSWKPATREHWAKLPKEVKEEIHRREKEIEKGLHQASGYRKVAEEYFQTLRPFEQLIRAQNSTPARAITSLMTTAARLTMGTKAQKAQTVAEIMQNYDVDIPTLDSILAGKAPKEEDDKLSKILDERLKPVTEFISSVQTSRQQAHQKSEEEVNAELEKFAADPKNEFFSDVVDDMADIMDLAAKRGQKLTLDDAYKKACLMNPEISKVINQREAAKKGELEAAALAKKRKAASSIKGARSEEGGGGSSSTDLRGTIAQAMADLEQSRI